MARAPRPWTVLRNEAIRRLEANLWVVDGEIPGMPLQRRMAVMRLGDGRLVIHNGVCLDESSMGELERFGEPAFLVVPNGWHRIDAHAWSRRYPRMRVLCPPEARGRVSQVVEVHGDYGDLPVDAAVRVERVEGGKAGEGVFLVTSGERVTAVFNDMLMNNARGPGFWWTIYAMTGSTGGPRVTGMMKLFGVRDAKAVRGHFERIAALPGLARLVPGHGAIVDEAGAAAVGLRAAAAGL